ncbi:MAG: hypothetical protein ACE5G0_22635, partial [Rhodothermales bacterium]
MNVLASITCFYLPTRLPLSLRQRPRVCLEDRSVDASVADNPYQLPAPDNRDSESRDVPQIMPMSPTRILSPEPGSSGVHGVEDVSFRHKTH